MKDSWNKRYGNKEYVYGKKPNNYLKQELDNLLSGKILFSAEGEGRNAVYAAAKGWDVMAFDISDKGKEKALRLASEYNVSIKYDIVSVIDIEFPDESFDCLGCFFMHLPKEIKTDGYTKLVSKLKVGGNLIFEAFSKEQINYNTGGPKNLEMLYSSSEIQELFKDFSTLNIEEKEVYLDEGPLHQGKARTIRVRGIK